jgi:heme O synthase-like polyprenyltransferase
MPTTFSELVDSLLGIINLIIPAIFAVVFVVLAWKVFDAWILNAADERKREEGKQFALVSVIVLVIMIVAWGIVDMVRRSLFG